jgi:transmembrane sensor
MNRDSTIGAPIPPDVAEQAVRWLVELQAAAANDARREAWQRWRRENPDHERAWQHIEAVNGRMRGAPGSLAFSVLDTPSRAARRRSLKLLALLAAGGTSGWVAKDTTLVREWRADYRTRVGERRTIELADGSSVMLNTDSALDVEFDGVQRSIHLIRGEILVTTAADKAPVPRPFLVKTPQGRLRAIGTHFNVRLAGARTGVSVLEGAVELRPAGRPDPAVVIPAGQAAVLTSDGCHELGSIDDGAAAWASGMIVASNMRLDDFLSELSRYRPGRLGCAAEIAQLRVSGTYPVENTERVLAALERALPLKVQRFTRYWVSVVPRRP